MKSLAISSGGTAGHINPALNIARKLAAKGWQIHYLGNKNSLEQKLVAQTEFLFYELDVQKLYRKFTLAHLKFPFKLLRSIIASRNILNTIKPDVFLGCGGFVSGPSGYAATLLNIPLLLQEQNSFPGLTTRLLAKKAEMIFLGNEMAEKYLKNSSTMLTGNPINTDLPAEVPSLNNQNTVFLAGGSQGSLALNNALLQIYEKLLSHDVKIIWQTGTGNYEAILKQTGEQQGLILFGYSNQINKYYQQADLIISRAGALTLAELETLRKPAILIPLPSSAENHQLYNARQQAEKNIAEVIEQKDLTADSLFSGIMNMLENKEAYLSRFQPSLHSGAADRIAEYIDTHYGR